jgi:hypothetical protein
MDANGLVGVQTANDGAKPIIRLGRQAEQVMQMLHGDYYESTFRNRVFSGGNAAGVTTSVGAATTHTGLCLTNPAGSGVNLVLNYVGVGELVAPAAAAIIGIATGFSATAVTQTTPITPQSNFVGNTQGAGLLSSAVTLPVAPTLRQVLGAMGTVAATSIGLVVPQVELKGAIIIPPGGYACTFTSTASGTSGMAFSFTWEEAPISG